MKKIMLILFVAIFSLTGMTAQEKSPTFEKEGDLVKATYFHENGSIKEVGYFKNDKLHDQWISYNEFGKVTVVANYNNGIKEGKWYIVGEDSVKEVTYAANKPIKVEEKQGTDLSFL